jgi:hypothetical protein
MEAMSFSPLTPERRAELDSLREDLRSAELRAAEATRGFGADHTLEGEVLKRLEEADHEVSEIRRRIKELKAPDHSGTLSLHPGLHPLMPGVVILIDATAICW